MIYFVRLLRKARQRRWLAFCAVLALVAVAILGNAVCFYWFEGGGDVGFDDALWYSVISITTIGYGDFYAKTAGARIGVVVFIVLVGLGAFSVFLGMLIDWVTEVAMLAEKGMIPVHVKDHVLIVNFPSVDRVSQLIEELRSEPEHKNREIVIVTDKIESLPFQYEDVLFVHGSVLEQETYRRAKTEQARLAIVLASSYTDPTSDAVTASAVAVIDSIRPDIYVVAECLNPKHRMLFDSVHCDAIVHSLRISGSLLAQEIHDPGIALAVDGFTSNVRGLTLFTAAVTEDRSDVTYRDLAKRLLDGDINLLCVNRDCNSLSSFAKNHPQKNDRAVYAGPERFSWEELLAQAGLNGAS